MAFTLVAHRVGLPFWSRTIRSGFTFSTSSATNPNCGMPSRIDLLFVAEGDWLQREDRFAGLVHRLNFVFEPRRGGARAQLAVSIYKDRSASGSSLSTDAGNVGGADERFADANCAAVAGNAHVANADIIIAGGKIRPGQIPQGSVAAAGVVQERLITVGRIEEAGVVVTERFITVGRVAVAAGVRRERSPTSGRVLVTDGVAKESNTVGRVEAASGVVIERLKTVSTVALAGGVARQRPSTVGRVAAAGGVIKERGFTVGRVADAGGVAEERSNTGGRVVVAFGVV